MTHGGKREGAGRKALPPEKKRKPHTVWLSAEEAQRLREIGGTVTGGIRVLLTQSVELARPSPCDIEAR